MCLSRMYVPKVTPPHITRAEQKRVCIIIRLRCFSTQSSFTRRETSFPTGKFPRSSSKPFYYFVVISKINFPPMAAESLDRVALFIKKLHHFIGNNLPTRRAFDVYKECSNSDRLIIVTRIRPSAVTYVIL